MTGNGNQVNLHKHGKIREITLVNFIFGGFLVIWNVYVDQDLLKHLTDLQNTIGTQLAVASSNVYPQFVRLALTWQGFQVLISYYV